MPVLLVLLACLAGRALSAEGPAGTSIVNIGDTPAFASDSIDNIEGINTLKGSNGLERLVDEASRSSAEKSSHMGDRSVGEDAEARLLESSKCAAAPKIGVGVLADGYATKRDKMLWCRSFDARGPGGEDRRRLRF